MKSTGSAGAAVIATDGIPVPTAPWIRPAHWPARPQRSAWTSPIPRPAADDEAALAATRRAERAAAAPAPRPARNAPAKTARQRAERAPRTTPPKSPAAPRAVRPAKPAAAPRPRTRKLDPVEVVRLYVDEQQSLTDIARVFDATPQSVRACLVTAGVARRPAHNTNAGAHFHAAALELRGRLRDDLTRLWATDASNADIAVALGISLPTVGRVARDLGLPVRRKKLDRDQVVALYAEHRSIGAVAAALDTSDAAVRYQLRQAGVAVRRPGDNGTRRSDADRATALAMYQAGAPVEDIYRALGITESTLHRWRKAAGIPARTPGRRPAAA